MNETKCIEFISELYFFFTLLFFYDPLCRESIIQHLKNSQNLESEKNALQRKEIELNRQISNFRTDVLELQEKIVYV